MALLDISISKDKSPPKQKRGLELTSEDRENLAKLTAAHRAILMAYEVADSYESIALAITVPVGTVKSRLNRARHAIVALRAV